MIFCSCAILLQCLFPPASTEPPTKLASADPAELDAKHGCNSLRIIHFPKENSTTRLHILPKKNRVQFPGKSNLGVSHEKQISCYVCARDGLSVVAECATKSAAGHKFVRTDYATPILHRPIWESGSRYGQSSEPESQQSRRTDERSDAGLSCHRSSTH